MSDLIVVDELQAHLIALGLAQHPDTPPSATPAVFAPMPRDGAPLPRDSESATITLTATLTRPATDLNPWIEEAFVDVIVRSVMPAPGTLLQRAIHDVLAPLDQLGGRKDWLMGALRVEYSREGLKPLQPLPQRQATARTDRHLTYDTVQSFCIACRRKTLAGLTIP